MTSGKSMKITHPESHGQFSLELPGESSDKCLIVPPCETGTCVPEKTFFKVLRNAKEISWTCLLI